MAQRTSKAGGRGRTSKRSTKTKTAGSSRRSGAARRQSSKSAAADEVSIDRRRSPDRRAAEPAEESAAPQLERRKKVNRRRQIDPTTCERDYTEDEVEFMNALDDYKRRSGRMFPTCSEVLEVVRGLGYAKLSSAELEALRATGGAASSAKPMPGDWCDSAALAVSPETGDMSADPLSSQPTC